jgi:hypothetical protein
MGWVKGWWTEILFSMMTVPAEAVDCSLQELSPDRQQNLWSSLARKQCVCHPSLLYRIPARHHRDSRQLADWKTWLRDHQNLDPRKDIGHLSGRAGISDGRSGVCFETKSAELVSHATPPRIVRSSTDLDFLLSESNATNDIQTGRFVWLGIPLILGFQNVFIFLAVGDASVLNVWGKRDARRQQQRVSKLRDTTKMTYLVRRRLWRASGLLSTSGGRLFRTVLGEWTRKARPPEGGLERVL